jgi:eukaryotic-like serine/threonine-protein kinase
MNRENWQKIKEIFNDALEIPPAGRAAFLNEACADDESLRREVEVLLKSFADDFLEKPAVGEVADAIIEDSISLKAGDRVGDYRIVKALGTGGQGAVFLAEDLQLKRAVALKFLPAATSDSSAAGRRFRREARAAAALAHPNICAIHKIDAHDTREFIVMQYVEGETLAARLKKGKPGLPAALELAAQIADALAEAHAHGVIHRDIKPSNIVVSETDQVSVLDFGLAKIQEGERSRRGEEEKNAGHGPASNTTLSGVVMGTVSYMSPEQARGEKVDFRTDIWSLGVCLYEMTAGKNPFLRENLAESFAAILSFEPPFDEFPPPLGALIGKTLRKNADERYRTANELLADLRALRSELSFEEQLRSRELSLEKPRPQKFRPGAKQIVAAALILSLLTIAAWFYRQNRNLSRARENIAAVAALAKSDKTFEAYDLAREIQEYLPDDENLAELMPLVADQLSVRTEPAGAKVFLRRFQSDRNGKFPEREFVGETPLEGKRIARGQYLLYIEKEGFAPFARSISGRLPDYSTDLIRMPPLEIAAKLVGSETVPERMVFVPGGEYKLVSYTRPTEKPAALGDFFIDRCEVSNAEFKEFITAGGYSRKEFWGITAGAGISFEDAVKPFKDRTGLPGPRAWTNQNFPDGKANFPVTGISWFEALAYARFRGKSLPTVFQWEKAARDGKFDEAYNTMPWGLSRDADSTEFLANFRGVETVAVDSFEFGMSPYGGLNMAGNAAEWLLNRRAENVLVGGGAFGEKPYLFGYYGDFPPGFSSAKIGLRLVKNLSETETGTEDLPPVEIPVYKASKETDLKKWLVHYAYDKTPLDAEIIESTETDAWTREKISFTGADREPAFGYLYLPKNAPRPLQVVHWIPAADVPLGFSSLPHSVEDFLAPVIKHGRAVFAVVVKGYHERPRGAGYQSPPATSIEFRKEMVGRVVDWRRGLDYLETRAELRKDKIAFLGLSSGANQGLILTAIEPRYAAIALVGVGVRPPWTKGIAEANLVNFAPHIKAPTLILKGRYDEAHPLKTEAEPLFSLLREPRRITIVESGHVPPPEIFAPAVNDWFDETLGKVFD